MRTIGAKLKWWLGLPVWCLVAQAAMAQAEQPKPAGGSPFVASYAIVILCIVLGLLVVNRPTGRKSFGGRARDD